jgi:hypothetical protein
MIDREAHETSKTAWDTPIANIALMQLRFQD